MKEVRFSRGKGQPPRLFMVKTAADRAERARRRLALVAAAIEKQISEDEGEGNDTMLLSSALDLVIEAETEIFWIEKTDEADEVLTPDDDQRNAINGAKQGTHVEPQITQLEIGGAR